jgi:hypothetical protein
MGGAVQAVSQAVGLSKKPDAPQAPAPTTEASKIESKASRYDEEQGARMRGARRRGRALLSDVRLNAESGVETLGGGNSLGQ